MSRAQEGPGEKSGTQEPVVLGNTTRRKCPRIRDSPIQGIMVSRAWGLSFSSVTPDPGLEDVGQILAGPQSPKGWPLDSGLRQVVAAVNSGKMGISAVPLAVFL